MRKAMYKWYGFILVYVLTPSVLPLSEGEGEGSRKSDKGEIVFIR